ncbi:hypothetical protein LTR66_013076 [Elasticomyces elasticus]|nr:hypothetical protein LTR66_013076 [Elasticomyces elasticus]
MSPSYNTQLQHQANDTSLSALLASDLNGHTQSMDGRQPEYSQPGLNSPYHLYNDSRSEDSSADQASAAQYHGPGVRSSDFSSSATPTSEYGLPPSTARSGSFPEYIQQPRSYADGQRYHPTSAQGGHPGGMPQPTSPSMPMPDGQPNGHQASRGNNSDSDVPIDPSIATSSPTYPPHNQYSPYTPQHEMPQYGQQPGVMPYTRPEWAGSYGHPGMHYAQHPASSSVGAPGMVAQAARPPAGGHPLSTVYSFVPIPGAQQHKRPRRRYEEIERMYKCGWNGCEKAYGTLNHLNAHVTMQSHGTKRTPEEFKEIRKEWKAKKKEEENARKQDEERQRQEHGRSAPENGAQPGQYAQHSMLPPQMGGPQLPPIGYAPAGGQAPAQYGGQPGQVDGTPQYASGQIYASSYPQSPYGQQGQMYQQSQYAPQTAADGQADVKYGS